MTRALLAGFSRPEQLISALRSAGLEARRPLEAFTPYPLPEAAALLRVDQTRAPWWMMGGGLTAAGLFYAMEWLSATRLYPFDQGGRPFDSWPTFFVAVVEISILAAALTGFVVVLVKGGLTRLHQPVFAQPAHERASQDQFLLALGRPEDPQEREDARRFLFTAGALWVEEAEL